MERKEKGRKEEREGDGKRSVFGGGRQHVGDKRRKIAGTGANQDALGLKRHAGLLVWLNLERANEQNEPRREINNKGRRTRRRSHTGVEEEKEKMGRDKHAWNCLGLLAT